LYGFPHDTLDDISKKHEIIKNLGFDSANFMTLAVVKGSKIYSMARNDGLISDEDHKKLCLIESPYYKKLCEKA
jgi:coproporphyrinogen III oxidase-like Fe-S oxidoreductase